LSRPAERGAAAAADWLAILAVTAWIKANPRPGLTVREVPVPGARTKVVEQGKALLSILLDEVLPEQAVDANSSTFEDRYGFSGRDRDLLIRGPGPAVGLPWLPHATVGWPLHAHDGFDPAAAGVGEGVLVENKVSLAAVPDAPERLIVFGGGMRSRTPLRTRRGWPPSGFDIG
jgi:hypothetical protein